MSNAKQAVEKHAAGKAAAKKETVRKDKKEKSGAIGGFIRKLSGGLMIPIALLPLAGLFLGVGAGFENVYKQITGDTSVSITDWGYIFTVFKMIGDTIFGNLPVLFALGVAVAFSDDKGVAVFTGIIAWIVFNATQSTMIFGLDANGDYSSVTELDIDSYQIGFWGVGSIMAVPTSVVATNIGITSMQTSVFGGILMGFWAAFMYNKFHEFEAPKVLGFFSGTRFVPIITFLTVPLWGFAFVMIWPAIGIGLDYLGKALGQVPYGFDALVFGIVERSLIPFGLHHAFYAPLWYTGVGGTLEAGAGAAQAIEGVKVGDQFLGDQGVWFGLQTLGIPYNIVSVGGADSISALGHTWTVTLGNVNNPTQIFMDGNTDVYATITEGINPGQYQQGKFPFMLLGLPAAGAAMIMAAKKENREMAMSVIGAASLTAFLTGITEPIEFTFLFLAPYLYYGFHIFMAGISFWLLDALGSHVGMTFSGGIFDYILFGILPDATGAHSNSWWIPIIGVIYAPIYYFVFYFVITKKDIKTPGREDGAVKLVSKDEYRKAKGIGANDKKAKGSKEDIAFSERVDSVIEAIGGLENTTSINACITKLRLMVKDRSKVDDAALMKLGAQGVVGKGKSVMAVFGVEAEKFKTAMLKKQGK